MTIAEVPSASSMVPACSISHMAGPVRLIEKCPVACTSAPSGPPRLTSSSCFVLWIFHHMAAISLGLSASFGTRLAAPINY